MMRSMSAKPAATSKGQESAAAKPPSKSKLVKRAHKALVKALEAHATIAASRGISIKKAQRAGAKLAAAAVAYADAVQAKTGLDNPFLAGSGMLDGETIRSLKAERTRIERAVTSGVPVVESAPDPAQPQRS